MPPPPATTVGGPSTTAAPSDTLSFDFQLVREPDSSSLERMNAFFNKITQQPPQTTMAGGGRGGGSPFPGQPNPSQSSPVQVSSGSVDMVKDSFEKSD